MDLIAVRIKGTVVTARYGTLTSGDVLRTDAAFAKHIVEDCGAGVYLHASREAVGEMQATSEPAASGKPARKRKD